MGNNAYMKQLIENAEYCVSENRYEEAFTYYLEAAQMGNAQAQCNVGYAYLVGEGIEMNYEQGVYWLEKAVAQDNIAAINNLAYCYEHGVGVLQDVWKAATLYRKAGMVLGDKNALANYERTKDGFHIGVMLNELQKEEKTIQFYLQQAEAGNANAQCRIGYAYLFGKDVEVDYQKAVYWIQKAADQEHAIAICTLAYCYEYGMGVQKHRGEAMWKYRVAWKMGIKMAEKNYKRLKEAFANDSAHSRDMTLGEWV